ncbi:nucleotidyltransferase family protein [Lysobacter aestuarii]|uniref:Nucleotidyltransferase family protein n=2 Tax=Marilutibacter aestuarii TaxID=1706195 RepID=A0A508ASD2_9GAMM|nr:nucleotidyltransferase family protein [Lysobacter aestuarii]
MAEPGRPAMSGAHLAIVLAAGGSQRLGRPKALLTRDGETLVHRVARLALESGPSRACVVVGAQADAVTDAVRDLPCRVVLNPDWREGMGGSLRRAGDAFASAGVPVLVLACDQPALALGHLQALLDGAARSSSGCAATRHGDAIGIPAVVPGEWFAGPARPAGDAGFARALRALPVEARAILDAPELLLNLDTADDVREAVARGWLDP